MKKLCVLFVIFMSSIVFAQIPVVDGRITNEQINYVDSTYSFTLSVNVDQENVEFGRAYFDYKFNKDGLVFMNAIGHMQGYDYIYEVSPIGIKKLKTTILLQDGNDGILLGSYQTDLVTFNFKIINFNELADICPQAIRFYSPNSNMKWINGQWNCSDTPLPVELVSFNANIDGGKIILSWTTATEINNYGFEIEKNGKIIGFVDGNGNSIINNYYTFIDNDLINSTYRLKQIDYDGTFEYSKSVSVLVASDKFDLYQNYPNPFNPVTTIKYEIVESSYINLSVYNVLGQMVSVLYDGYKEQGIHSIIFDGGNLPSGLYIYKLSYNDISIQKRMTLLK